MVSKSRVTILVKASPQPSKRHTETVCCAGLRDDGTWQRLFPIRFRRLAGEKAFKRWDTVEFSYDRPRDDARSESCRVHEESILVTGAVKNIAEKSSLIERALVASENEAMENEQSLAVIRPKEVSLTWKRLREQEMAADKDRFASQAAQLSLLEDEIAAYEPCPYKFTMRYSDGAGVHKKTCADWETSATFFNLRQSMQEIDVLKHLNQTYCHDYVMNGLVFALGNMKKRPRTWQLLGIFPVRQTTQPDLFGR